METIKRTKIVDVLKSEAFGTTVNVKGWVRTRRGSKQYLDTIPRQGAKRGDTGYRD